MAGSASFIFVEKLNLLKDKILQWKKKEFGGLEERKLRCLHWVEVLDKKGFVSSLPEEEKGTKIEALTDHNRYLGG